MLSRYLSQNVPQLLKRLQPQLSGLRNFSLIILMSMAPVNISHACIWGTLALLLEVSYVCPCWFDALLIKFDQACLPIRTSFE